MFIYIYVSCICDRTLAKMVLQILKLSMVVAPNQGISGHDVYEPESCWAAQCWRHVDAKFSMLLGFAIATRPQTPAFSARF